MNKSISAIFSCFIDRYIISINYSISGQYQDQGIITGIGLALTIIRIFGGTIILGVNQGFASLTGKAIGVGNTKLAEKYFHQQICTLYIIITILTISICFSYYLLIFLNQDMYIAENAWNFGTLIIPGYICYYFFDFLRSYLNCIGI